MKIRELVEAQLAKMFDRYLVNEEGNYVLGLDTARVFVVPTWLEDEQTVIRIFAITNLEVPVTAALTNYLLAQNLEFVLGAFALDAENGAVWFNHNLLGDFMAAGGVRVVPSRRRPDRRPLRQRDQRALRGPPLRRGSELCRAVATLTRISVMRAGGLSHPLHMLSDSRRRRAAADRSRRAL